jgi:hypothetical protein
MEFRFLESEDSSVKVKVSNSVYKSCDETVLCYADINANPGLVTRRRFKLRINECLIDAVDAYCACPCPELSVFFAPVILLMISFYAIISHE